MSAKDVYAANRRFEFAMPDAYSEESRREYQYPTNVQVAARYHLDSEGRWVTTRPAKVDE